VVLISVSGLLISSFYESLLVKILTKSPGQGAQINERCVLHSGSIQEIREVHCFPVFFCSVCDDKGTHATGIGSVLPEPSALRTDPTIRECFLNRQVMYDGNYFVCDSASGARPLRASGFDTFIGEAELLFSPGRSVGFENEVFIDLQRLR
jgi:hypothetical protein